MRQFSVAKVSRFFIAVKHSEALQLQPLISKQPSILCLPQANSQSAYELRGKRDPTIEIASNEIWRRVIQEYSRVDGRPIQVITATTDPDTAARIYKEMIDGQKTMRELLSPL